MKAIDPRWLPQTVTLYNLWIDPADGTRRHFRTMLSAVRVGQSRVTLAATLKGFERRARTVVTIDRRTTQGRDAQGQAKTYLPPDQWAGLPEAGRSAHWTLGQGDRLAARLGARETLAPDFPTGSESRFVESQGLQTIVSLRAVIDWDGAVHHWEAELD